MNSSWSRRLRAARVAGGLQMRFLDQDLTQDIQVSFENSGHEAAEGPVNQCKSGSAFGKWSATHPQSDPKQSSYASRYQRIQNLDCVVMMIVIRTCHISSYFLPFKKCMFHHVPRIHPPAADGRHSSALVDRSVDFADLAAFAVNGHCQHLWTTCLLRFLLSLFT